MAHPNRSKKGPRWNPSVDEIQKARTRAGLTQEQAAGVIHGTLRGWQDYEGGQRNMHPGLFELFKIKTGQEVQYQTPEERIGAPPAELTLEQITYGLSSALELELSPKHVPPIVQNISVSNDSGRKIARLSLEIDCSSKGAIFKAGDDLRRLAEMVLKAAQ